jgi:tRNA (cmo5U34)-methyltransferase
VAVSQAAGNGARSTPWQESQVAANFLERRRSLLPQLEVQEQIIGHLLTRRGRLVEAVLDLGGGDGAMTQLALAHAPQARAVLVDFSEPMLERARARFAAEGGRSRAVRADLREATWAEALQEGRRFDLAISGLAIHHLDSRRKRELFKEVFDLLSPGGLFVNMDIVAVQGPLQGLFEEQMLANAECAAGEQGHGGRHEIDFDGDEDRPDSAEDQLRWLHEAGFAEAEVQFKWAEAAILGAVKPT